MFKLLVITLMSISGLAFGQTLKDCVNQASYYGVDFNAPKISDNCKNIIVENANLNSIDYSSDNYIQAFAAGNIIHVLFHTANNQGQPQLTLSGLTSGKFTGLTNVQAIDVDEANKMIYALNLGEDGVQTVVSVQADRDGALAARAKLHSDEIQGATNIKTDRANEELYVFGSEWIKVFNIDANYRSTLPAKSINVKRSIEGNNTNLFNIKDIAVAGSDLYVLDGTKVLKFNRVSTEADSIPELITSGVSSDAIGIEVDQNILIITLADFSEVQIQL